MSTRWRHPGRTGAVLYGVLAAVVGAIVGVVSRLQVVKQRGRTAAANALPPGAIIVISNHTSYADGVLLALACRRLGRELRLLATAGVFRVPLIDGLALQQVTTTAAQAAIAAAPTRRVRWTTRRLRCAPVRRSACTPRVGSPATR